MSGDTIGFVAGCTIIGLAIVVVTLITGGAEWNGWPHEWDTLIVGLLAVVGATFSIRAVRQQITQVEAHRRDDLQRENVAARAALPVALSALTRYAKGCADELLPATKLDQNQLAARQFSFPTVPDQIIPVVRDCVRFADGGKRDELADLLSELQVQQTRIFEFANPDPDHIRVPVNVIEYCLDAIVLYGRASALFDYGRRKPDSPLQSLQGSAMLCGAIPGVFPEVDERIAQHAASYLAEMQAYRE